ncbi:MAG: response regulator [Rhodoferax sp.]|uniref:hybrid sensor histidine kinase/response regulator n=1 Tax=Rhodoferax sp. TaxID=50421 RepID=UPI0014009C89|nr:ATP-binding protein [Rhodoferax sp.]NDP39304.1 response regulator [Rhodoferax sp.]
MKLDGIRNRMLLAALLPAALVAFLLAAVFLLSRFEDINTAHRQRARSLVRQLATACEYGVFSGNVSHLQSLASGALRESDVRSMTVVDAQGRFLVRAGQAGYTTLPRLTLLESEQFEPRTQIDLLLQPIFASQVPLDDLYAPHVNAGGEAAPARAEQPVLGYVLVEFSRAALNQGANQMLITGVAITLGGLLFGALLAARLGRGVIRPIARVSRLIERIGAGELSARARVLPDDPLRDVQQVLNVMAQRLESGRDELEQRIATATQALREKKEEAETATLSKSRFLAAASHDLRQPMHAMGMFVARLAQLPHEASTAHLIGNLEASVRALQELLDGLLDVSRLETQAVPVQLRAFALADLFEQLRASLALTAQQKGLGLRVRPTQVWVLSDSALLHRILLNLLSNALRYTSTGHVLLACRVDADGQHVRIEVWDSGMGIAPEHQAAVFKEFFQVGNGERDRNKGQGLGLSIVERSAQLLGTPMQMRSSLGRGTRFSLRVPLAPPGVAHERRSPLRPSSFEDIAALRVLVIEDDPLVRDALVSLLGSWQVEVVVAEGLAMALALLKSGAAPDVIVADYRLREGENGIEVIRQLRAAAGHAIPACLVSGDTEAALLQAAAASSLTLLHKPVRPAKLRSLLRRLSLGAQMDAADDGA